MIDNYGPVGDDRQGAVVIFRFFETESRLEPVEFIPLENDLNYPLSSYFNSH